MAKAGPNQPPAGDPTQFLQAPQFLRQRRQSMWCRRSREVFARMRLERQQDRLVCCEFAQLIEYGAMPEMHPVKAADGQRAARVLRADVMNAAN